MDEKKRKNKSGKMETVLTATGDLTFDRTKYGVNYRTEAGFLKAASNAAKFTKDKIIKDDIKLTLSLETQKI